MKHGTAPSFPADCAFVIQFAHPHIGGSPRPGRIEHIVSGRTRRFQDGTELIAVIAEMLAAIESDAAAQEPLLRAE